MALHIGKTAWRDILILGLLLLFCGCTTYIVPPSAPHNPVAVCVVRENNFHASLMLPDNAGSVAYAYGEWKWFALEKTGSCRILPILLFPSQGTLARRHFDFPPDQAAKLIGAKRVLSFWVSKEDALSLRRQLDARFAAAKETEIYNSNYQTYFVKDPANYSGWHNCNNALALWLRELGCQIQGPAMWGKFRLTQGRGHKIEGLTEVMP